MTQMSSKSDVPPYNNVDIGTLPIPNQHVITYVNQEGDSTLVQFVMAMFSVLTRTATQKISGSVKVALVAIL